MGFDPWTASIASPVNISPFDHFFIHKGRCSLFTSADFKYEHVEKENFTDIEQKRHIC